MTRRTRRWVGSIVALLCCAAAASAQQASQEEVEELKRALEQQEKAVRDLRERLNAIEGKEPAAVPPALTAPPPAPEAREDVPTSPIEEAEEKMYGRASQVRYRGNFEDKQEAASRPADYVLDPNYRGFIPVPRTAFMIKFNPRPRLDLIYDDGDNGSDMRFVPGLIPTDDQGGGARFNANGNGSQLRVDVQAPTLDGNFRFYYQNDFFGSDDSNFRYRLQHLYGQFHGVVGGFTYGVFEDPDAWPDTVDYEGPNAVIFARRPLLHYKRMVAEEWQITAAVEDPDMFIDTSGNAGAGRKTVMPDLGFNVRWLPGDLGHVQFSTIFRTLGVDGGESFGSDEAFGWGTNIAGSLNITDTDTAQFWFVYGEGIGGMGNDASFFNSDAALDANGDLVALDYFSGLLAFTHHWAPRWRSTGTYGYVNLQNADLQPDDAYDQTHYASVNLVYQVFKRLSVGVEGLYGYKQVKSGSAEDGFRLHVGVLYSLFD